MESRHGFDVEKAKFGMRQARRRYKQETKAAREDSFRGWARKTYNAKACRGKLLGIVAVTSAQRAS